VQMYACLSGCLVTAKRVNLIGDGIRHDVYGETNEIMGLDMLRKALKDALMTHFYSSTAIPKETFGEDLPRFYEAMETALPGATDVMVELKKCQAHIKESYIFADPSGYDVYVRCRMKVDKKIECKLELGDDRKNFHFKQQLKVFGRGKKEDRSIPAAVAHTCDSWLKRTAIKEAKLVWGFDVYHCHDKFFCSPKYMNRFRMIVRELLAKLAEDNYLERVVRDITGQPYTYTKKSTTLGDEIRKSDYFLS